MKINLIDDDPLIIERTQTSKPVNHRFITLRMGSVGNMCLWKIP